jgi:hypothetical protein
MASNVLTLVSRLFDAIVAIGSLQREKTWALSQVAGPCDLQCRATNGGGTGETKRGRAIASSMRRTAPQYVYQPGASPCRRYHLNLKLISTPAVNG